MDNTTSKIFGLHDCRFENSVIENKNGRKYQHHYFVYEGPVQEICTECGERMYKHGSRIINVTDIPREFPVKWSIEIPRRRCKNCKNIWQPSIKGIDEKRDLSDKALLNIAERSLRDSFETIAYDYMLAGNTIKNVFIEFLQIYEKELRFVTPSFIGIDEIKIKKLGELTVITDLEHRTLFDILKGRNQKSLTEYFSNLDGREGVLWVCSDMYRPFEGSIGSSFPNARWVIDHFHVVMKANEAVDAVRRTLQATMSKPDRIKTKRGLAYTLKTRSKDLTAEEASKIKALRDIPDLKPLAIAFDLKEDFFNIYDENPSSKDKAIEAFEAWEMSIPADAVYEKFRELAGTVHRFKEQIFNYWDCPVAITNGFTECSNRIIRENNLRGRGYSFEILRGRTLYRKSNFDKLLHSGMVKIGPVIPREGYVFHMEGTNESLSELFGKDFDPETGEILE